MFKTKIQDKVRDHLIQKCDFNCYAPDYLLSIDYFSDYSRQEIQKNHKWITKVVSDVFNPYDRNPILWGFFIEKGKKTIKKYGKQTVFNTITEGYELDDDIEVVDGTRHTHALLSLPYVDLGKPNKNMRKLWRHMFYDIGGNPPHWMFEDGNQYELKLETLEFAIKDRCANFLGSGEQALDIQTVDNNRQFDGTCAKGWHGALHYVTKQIKEQDDWYEVFDDINSNVLDNDPIVLQP